MDTYPVATSFRKIAVLKALHLGDLLLTVPALRALRRGCPGAEITLIGLPWADQLVRRLTYLDRLLPFPGYPGMGEVEVDEQRLEAFFRQARAYRYDLAVQLHGNGSASNPFIAELGARYVAGYYVDPQHQRLLNWALPYRDSEPEVLRCLRLVESMGLPSHGANLEFPLLPSDHDDLDRVVPDPVHLWRRPIVAINPGARAPARRWNPANFAAVAAGLHRQRAGTVVLLGAKGEEPLARQVTDLAGIPVIDLSGKTSLGALAALISRADLLVTNDTGTAHLGVALATKSVTVFGPADVRRWAPLDQTRHRVVRRATPCQPCLHWECPAQHECLTRVTPEEVLDACKELLAS
ncbi:MAG: glycosyltransferase family 9 protein [Chloroflexota bacterium]